MDEEEGRGDPTWDAWCRPPPQYNEQEQHHQREYAEQDARAEAGEKWGGGSWYQNRAQKEEEDELSLE